MLGLYHTYLGQGDVSVEVSLVIFPTNSKHAVKTEEAGIYPIYEFTAFDSKHITRSEQLTIVFNPVYFPRNSRHQIKSDEPSLVTVTFIIPEHSKHLSGSATVKLSLEGRVFSGVQWVNKIK